MLFQEIWLLGPLGEALIVRAPRNFMEPLAMRDDRHETTYCTLPHKAWLLAPQPPSPSRHTQHESITSGLELVRGAFGVAEAATKPRAGDNFRMMLQRLPQSCSNFFNQLILRSSWSCWGEVRNSCNLQSFSARLEGRRILPRRMSDIEGHTQVRCACDGYDLIDHSRVILHFTFFIFLHAFVV